MAKKFRLHLPQLAAEVEKLLERGGRHRDMQRLTAVRLGLGGQHTLEQIGTIVGRARSRVTEWMRIVREEGVEALLGRHQGKGAEPQVTGKVSSKGCKRGCAEAAGNAPRRRGNGLNNAMASH